MTNNEESLGWLNFEHVETSLITTSFGWLSSSQRSSRDVAHRKEQELAWLHGLRQMDRAEGYSHKIFFFTWNECSRIKLWLLF